jgi:spore coat protein CotH
VCALVLAAVFGIAWHVSSLSGHSWVRAQGVFWFVKIRSRMLAEQSKPWPAHPDTPRLEAGLIHNAQDLYRTTNIWVAHFSFTPAQWEALEPKRIEPMPNFVRPDGMWTLRNPKAQRGGVAGVLGFQFDWTHADFEFGGRTFTNVAARAKGNIRSLSESLRAYKVDLNDFVSGQKLAGLDELTFDSFAWDYSCMGEALAYELFRDLGVPAPRTAYAWLSVTVPGRWERRPLGLYVMIEAVDQQFAGDRFGSKATPIFKPSDYELFKYLGEDWTDYAPIYDLKTRATPAQQNRLIAFTRLVSMATDEEFAAQVGSFLDLDEFARFLAGEVLLANYDCLLSTGQNFYMYLDPRSNKFGFIPWDLDAAWGDFWLASKPEFERASIWHPWAGRNRLLERLLAVPEFRRIYRLHLEDFVARLFVPERIDRRIQEIAEAIREPVAAASAFRLDKFEQTVGLKPALPLPGDASRGFDRPAYPLRRFIENRARSVRQQLNGKARGIILKLPQEK